MPPLAQHLLNILDGVLGHDQRPVVEQVVGVGLGGADDANLLEVAEGKERVDVLVIDDDGDATLATEGLESLGSGLGRGLLEVEAVDDEELVCRELAGKHGCHGELDDLVVHAESVGTGMRAKDNAAMTELRGARRALTGAAGTLLAERLTATAGNLTAGLGVMRTLTTSGHLAANDLMDACAVGLDGEDAIGYLDRARRLASGVSDLDLCH